MFRVLTACPGHTPATSRRHDLISTSSFWLLRLIADDLLDISDLRDIDYGLPGIRARPG
jgi:hypothetical protein